MTPRQGTYRDCAEARCAGTRERAWAAAGVSGRWRRGASKTSPRTLNGAYAGRRHGASQDGGGVENEPARGVSGRRRCRRRWCGVGVAAAGIKNEPAHAQRSVRGRCKAAVWGKAAAWGIAGRRWRRKEASARAQGRCRASAAQGVENESTHAHGGVRRALQGGGGAGRRKRATHTQQSVRGRRHKYGGRKVYEKLAFQQRDIDNDAPRKSQLVTEPLADAWADALSRGSPRIA
ncbi:hypothetical protein GGX14DRAFT_398880 [Mycena pura]|uniref:Uncharacterized protein n=1 Tax=Mycena pura TaxID=153505 RepID=A0AAD6VCP3_9AGAR|nr:hypothetical protein GGX14DRAFT_398880 [Mycena pura]